LVVLLKKFFSLVKNLGLGGESYGGWCGIRCGVIGGHIGTLLVCRLRLKGIFVRMNPRLRLESKKFGLLNHKDFGEN
jgi:hypothetical protein